ncbi:hypothetical protein BBK36DRAFT_1124478, partial [Trichoderma citrinoviride]
LRRCTQPCQDNDHVPRDTRQPCASYELRRCTQPCQDNDHVLKRHSAAMCFLRTTPLHPALPG